jgi:cation diffusion facilitator family transporter
MNQQNAMKKSFFVNIFLVIFKLISGFVFNSSALIADGVHSVSDLLSDIFVLLGIRHSVKPADEDHPFGHGKFEYVLSLFLGISIIVIAYNLGKNVILGFNEITVIPSYLSLVVILIVVVVKLYLARYLIKRGKELDSEIISASGQESFSDVISSGVVFIGVISVFAGEFFNIDFLTKGDKVSSIIIALFIVRIGIKIIWDAIQSLQGRTVKKEICEVYKEIIEVIDGVLSVDQLDMIAYGPYYQAIVEIQVNADISVKAGHDIAHTVYEKLLENEKICHVSVHVNPEEQI